MVHGKKPTVMIHTGREYDRELKALYDRKTVLDNLIASLEAYDRYRSSQAVPRSVTSGRARKLA